MIGFDRNSSDTIGFVYSALAYNVITRDDVREWAINVVSENDVNDLPIYVIDLMDFNSDSPSIQKIIGFVPTWRSNGHQRKALYGVALKRGRHLVDINISEEVALSALKKHPEVEQRFRDTFPFIDF